MRQCLKKVLQTLSVCVAVAWVNICATPASARVTIVEDRGGQIGHYLYRFYTLRDSGEEVVIDGNCLSACTMALGILRPSQLRITPRARFGFHAAWTPDENGLPVTSPLGTQALWNVYPPNVRRWINRHGGLGRKMIFLQGHELAAMYSPPKPQRQAARSSRTPTNKQQAAAH